jgi:3-dehydroquinate dehydratase-2
MTILILNGPNLNRLGRREPETYGPESLDDIRSSLESRFPGITLEFLQSNHEGELIEALHGADDRSFAGVVFNPGGYTHTSVALRDAVSAIDVPVIEVHLSNIHSRERFRHYSMIAPVSAGQILGFGAAGYSMAVQALIDRAAAGK